MRVRRFTMDLPADDQEPPAAGDIVHSTRVTYRVTSSRPVDSRLWCNRWALTLERVAPDVVPDLGARAFHTRPYRRGETPADFFGPQ